VTSSAPPPPGCTASANSAYTGVPGRRRRVSRRTRWSSRPPPESLSSRRRSRSTGTNASGLSGSGHAGSTARRTPTSPRPCRRSATRGGSRSRSASRSRRSRRTTRSGCPTPHVTSCASSGAPSAPSMSTGSEMWTPKLPMWTPA
jgi:hypothetical protein